MGTISRNLIKYEGIEVSNCANGTFKQTNIDNIFCLPIIKLDIERMVKVCAKANICKYKLINTPVGVSLEGQKLTGYKLIIMGEIEVKYEYITLEKSQGIHTAHSSVPFCSYIVMPDKFNPRNIVYPMVLIEDIHSEQINTRCIYTNFTIRLSANIC